MLKGEVIVQELVDRLSSAGSGACACGKQTCQCSGSHGKATHTGKVG